METNKLTVKLYWQQIKKYKISFFVSLFAIPIASLSLDTLLPYFLSQAIGNLGPGANIAITNNIMLSSVIMMFGVTLNLIGFQSLIHHESNIRYELSRETFLKLIGKDLNFFVNEKIGSLTSRYIDFLRSHVLLQDLLIIRTLGFVISIMTGLIIVSIRSPLVGLILIGLLALIIFQVRFSIRYRKPYRHARKELMAESNGRVADALTNSLIVKTFANETTELEQIDSVNKDYQKMFRKDLKFLGLEGTVRIFFMSIVQITSIAICAGLVGSGQMNIPTAVFILVYLQRISTQLFALGEIARGYDQALLDAAPMSEMLSKEIKVIDKNDAVSIKNIKPSIEIKDVYYQYEKLNGYVLNGIDLSIEAGAKIGLVGHSGAGKTTLTHLILRFADVTKGSILIDGHDIRDITQESLRRNIAYVSQEPMLFHRSLRDNIIYGKPDATEKEIARAIKQANAEEFIEKLPHGINTIVGERGVKLSSGQKQRVAIARALLKDAPILILDEATSALDSESEKLIQSSLEKLMKGRTSIVIAHRLSTIASLDYIVVIGDGKIVEKGTHQELLSKNKIYARLWNHQSGGFIQE